MIPTVPTDNLYKFCALSGIILCVATLYYGAILADQTSQKIDDYDAATKKQTIVIDDLTKSAGNTSKDVRLLEIDLEATKIRLQRARFRLHGLYGLTAVFSSFGGFLATYGFMRWRVVQRRQDELLFREPKS